MRLSEDEKIGAIVLAGNTKIKKQLRRRKRRGFIYKLFKPSLWGVNKEDFETILTSKVNKDDYIVGENKSLLYLHPDLISQKNLNFLKRTLYFAGKTGDRIYSKNKMDLLRYLSRNGETSISLVMKAIIGSERIDRDRCVIIGPKKQIGKEMKRCGLHGITIEEQGDSIGENLLIGKKSLERIGYSSNEVCVIGGDIPLLETNTLNRFLSDAIKRGRSPDIWFGMGSRRQLRQFISENHLESLGEVGPNYPKKNHLNKFGIPLIDDIGLFDRKGELDHFMMGNIFMINFSKIDQDFVNRFYSLRKMGANPLTYPYLISRFFKPLWKSIRGNLTLSEAEIVFRKTTGVDLKVIPTDPKLTLDLDSYSDLRRLSMVRFHLLSTDHDLEMQLKHYLRDGMTLSKKI